MSNSKQEDLLGKEDLEARALAVSKVSMTSSEVLKEARSREIPSEIFSTNSRNSSAAEEEARREGLPERQHSRRRGRI
jgi:hypothetical protein